MIVYCNGSADVISAVNFARENNLITAIRSGGHNVSGNCLCEGGVVIDLSRMNGVWVDPKKKVVKVQGGALWSDVDRETQVFGLMTPGGVVSSTGVAGLTLSGGIGWTRRKHGLTVDNLLSVDLITAAGEYITASEDENTDLFWALKGGGGNFGIVTSFDFKLHELGPEVMFAATLYPIKYMDDVIDTWYDKSQEIPEEITLDMNIWSIPKSPMFPQELHHQKVAGIFGFYTGDSQKGEQALQFVREVAQPVADLSNRMPFTVVQSAFDSVYPKNEQLHYWKSIYMDEINEKAWSIIKKYGQNRPVETILIFIRHFGGAVDRPDHATAFGKRAKYLISIDSTWLDPKDTEKCIAWTQAFWNALRPYSNGQTYFGFAGSMEEQEELVSPSFGTNYSRLEAIKAKYDPDNFFRLNQNIKPR